MPIGLMGSCVGGTYIEQWTPPGGALAYALDVRTGFDCVEDAWERPQRTWEYP